MSLDPLLSGVEKSLLMHNVGTKIKESLKVKQITFHDKMKVS